MTTLQIGLFLSESKIQIGPKSIKIQPIFDSLMSRF